jgi:hypothetical protein
VASRDLLAAELSRLVVGPSALPREQPVARSQEQPLARMAQARMAQPRMAQPHQDQWPGYCRAEPPEQRERGPGDPPAT